MTERARAMRFNPHRSLFLWSIWAIVTIIIYLTLYVDAKVWVFIEQDPSRITWIIMAMFFLGFLASGVVTLFITVEGVRLKLINRQAARGGLQEVVKSSGKVNRAVVHFFQSLQATLDAEGQPDVELLANIELAVLQRISHTVEVVGNLLITMGLIGTVMGLTFTLTGLTNSLEALGHDQEMLLQGLQKAMGGMGTAFYTTLLGAVLGGVVLRVFSHINENGVNALYDQLMSICMVYCSAEYKPSISRDVRFLNHEMSVLQENIRHIERAFSDSREAMSEFRNDLVLLTKESEEGEDGKKSPSLEHVILRHRAYCEVLREEVRLIQAVNRSWWARLKILFNIKP